MPYYENVFIARQDISSTQVEAIADAMAEIITTDGGTVARREYWGLKSLAYRMKKNKKGHFVLFNIDASIEAVREMERQMGLHEDVLRFMTLRTDDLPEDASVMMASAASAAAGTVETVTVTGIVAGASSAAKNPPRRKPKPPQRLNPQEKHHECR